MLRNQHRVQHNNHRIHIIRRHPHKTHIRAHQAKIVWPVTAMQTQVTLVTTACLIHFIFQVNN